MTGVSALVRAAFSRRRVLPIALEAMVVALAAAGLAAGWSVRADAGDQVDSAFAAAAGPHLVAWVDADASAKAMAALSGDPRVEAVGAPTATLDTTLGTQFGDVDAELRSADQATGAVNVPALTSGRWPAGTDEVVVDGSYADDTGLAVGDRVTLGERPVEVVGVAHDFTDCFHPSCDPIRVWVAPAVVGNADATLVAARVDAAVDVAAVDADLQARLGAGYLGGNLWPDTRADLLVETEVLGAFLAVFGGFVLVASAVVIGGAIVAQIAARERARELFHALGCTPGQLAAATVIEHAVVGLGAAVLGCAAAGVLAPHLAVGSLAVLGGGPVAWSWSAVGVAVGAVLVIVPLAAAVPAMRAARVRGASTRGAGRVWGGAGLPVRLGLRSAAARPARTLLAAAAVTLAVVAALVSLGITRSVDRVIAHPELTGDPAELLVGSTDPAVDAALAADPAVASWYRTAEQRGTADGEPLLVGLLAGDPDAPGYVVGEGRMATAAGEAVAGYALLDARGWQLGDTVEVVLGAQATDVEIVGWYRETEDGGEVLRMRADSFDADWNTAVNLVPGGDPEDVAARLGPDVEVAVATVDEDHVRPFTVALAILAGLIGTVTLAHLAAASLTSARERAPRARILAALGMTRAQLAAEAATVGAVVAGLAVAAGIPLGLLASTVLGNVLTSELGAGPGITLPATPVQTVALALTALVATVALWTTTACHRGSDPG